VWYIDSGCSNHMTGNKVFVDLDESITSEVRTSDDERISVKGKSDILVQTKKGVKRISSVLYVSGFKHYLLSVSHLLLRGFHVHFNEDMCEINDKHDTLITKVKMTQSKMSPFKLNSQIDSCMHTTIQDKSWLCHFLFRTFEFQDPFSCVAKILLKACHLLSLKRKYVKDAHLAKASQKFFPSWKIMESVSSFRACTF